MSPFADTFKMGLTGSAQWAFFLCHHVATRSRNIMSSRHTCFFKMILLQSKTFSQHKARWYSCTKTAINHAHQALYDTKLMNIIIAISTRMSVNKTILQSLRRWNWKSYIRRGQVVHKNFSWAFNSQKRGVGTQARQGYTQHVELKLLMRGSRQFLAQLKFWIGFKWYCTSNLFCGHLLKTLN